MLPQISVHELKELIDKKKDICILDVRNQNEYEICNLGGILIPLTQLPMHLDKLDKSKTTVVHCHAGGRSAKATEYLLQQGFKNVFNLQGGITAWANEIDK